MKAHSNDGFTLFPGVSYLILCCTLIFFNITSAGNVGSETHWIIFYLNY